MEKNNLVTIQSEIDKELFDSTSDQWKVTLDIAESITLINYEFTCPYCGATTFIEFEGLPKPHITGVDCDNCGVHIPVKIRLEKGVLFL